MIRNITSSILEYPRLKKDMWETVKIRLTEYNKIKHLYNTGIKIIKIAEVYHVHPTTIKRIVDPQYKKNIYKKNAKRKSFLWYNDKNFRKRSQRLNHEYIKRRKNQDNQFHEWNNKLRLKFYHDNEEELREKARQYYRNNIKNRLKYREHYYIKNKKKILSKAFLYRKKNRKLIRNKQRKKRQAGKDFII